MKPVQLILPIGLPGSGKTTWVRAMFPDHRIISSDDVRQAVSGNGYDASRNEEVWDIYFLDIAASLADGINVVADATNLTLRNRARTLECVPAGPERWGEDVDVHAIVFKNVAQSIVRNAARTGTRNGEQRVPNEAMMGFVKLYEESLQDILTEGYDTITYIEGWG